MGKGNLAPFVLSLLCLAGCGNSKTSTLTCDINDRVNGVRLNQCTQLTFAPSEMDAAAATCTRNHGTTNFEPCRTAGALGRCDGVAMDGVSATIWMFPDDLVRTAAGASAKCSALGGTLLALGSGDGAGTTNLPVPLSCRDDNYCFEALDPTATQATAVETWCSQNGFAPPERAPCRPIAPTAGRCEGTADVGAYRLWVSTALTWSEISSAASECRNYGGTWVATR